MVNGEWTLTTPVQTLNISKKGDLAKPSVSCDSSFVGYPALLTIDTVLNAEIYTVTVNNPNGSTVYRRLVSAQELIDSYNCVEIDANKLYLEGTYAYSVMVSGTGYDQNETTGTFTLSGINLNLVIAKPGNNDQYVAGGPIDIDVSQNGGGYMRVTLTDEDGVLLAEYPGNGLLTKNARIQKQYLPQKTGEITITATVYPVDAPVAINNAQSQKSVTVTVIGPDRSGEKGINAIQPGTKKANYTWIEGTDNKTIYVRCNDAVDRVELSLNGVSLGTESEYEYDNWVRVFAFEAPTYTAGRQTAIATVYDDDLKDGNGQAVGLQLSSFDYYYAQKLTNSYIVYPKSSGLTLKSSPIMGSEVKDAKVVGGEYVQPLTVTHDAGDWLRTKTVDEKVGFIQLSDVSEDLPVGTNKKLVVLSPASNTTYDVNTSEISVQWASGLALPSELEMQAYILDPKENKVWAYANVSKYAPIKLDISSLDTNTGYRLWLKVKDINGHLYGADYVLLNVDKLTEEQKMEIAYREWYQSPNGPFAAMKEYGRNYLVTRSTSFFYGAESQKAVEVFDILTNAYLTDEKAHFFWWKSEKVGLDHVTLPQEERMEFQYVIIGDMLRNENIKVILQGENGEIEIKGEDSVKRMIEQKSEDAILMQKCETLFTGLEMALASLNTIIDGVKIGLTASGHDTKTVDSIIKTINDVAEGSIETAKAIVESVIKETDNQLMIARYVDIYEETLTAACDEYVKCLEEAYFGESDATSSISDDTGMTFSQAAAYNLIKQFKSYKKELATMPGYSGLDRVNNETMKNIICELMVASGFEKDDVNDFLKEKGDEDLNIQKVLKEALPEIFEAVVNCIIDTIVADIIDEIYDQLVEDKVIVESNETDTYKTMISDAVQELLKATLSFKLVEDSDGNYKFRYDAKWDDEEWRKELLSKVQSKMAGGLSAQIGLVPLFRYIFIDDIKQLRYDNLPYGEILKQANKGNLDAMLKGEKLPVAGTIIKAFKNAWKTGSKIGQFISDMKLLDAYENGLEKLSLYSTLFYDSMVVRKELYIKSSLLQNWAKYASEGISSLSVEELESIRSSLISMIQAEKQCSKNLYEMSRAHALLTEWHFKTYDGKITLEKDDYFDYAPNYYRRLRDFDWSLTLPDLLQNYVDTITNP